MMAENDQIRESKPYYENGNLMRHEFYLHDKLEGERNFGMEMAIYLSAHFFIMGNCMDAKQIIIQMEIPGYGNFSRMANGKEKQ